MANNQKCKLMMSQWCLARCKREMKLLSDKISLMYHTIYFIVV